MGDPTSIGLLGIYLENSSAPRCQTVQSSQFTNRSWAELVLLYLEYLQDPPLAPATLLTANNIDNITLWMEACNPPSSWWGTTVNNNPLSLGRLQQVLTTIMRMETGPVGDYSSLTHGTAYASGAYQIEQPIWTKLTSEFGIGTQYAYAAAAPPGIQDLVVASKISQILHTYGNNVSVIPLIWYTGNAQGTLSATLMAQNNGLTPEAYQASWMAKFNSLSAGFPASGDTYPDLATAAYKTAQTILSSPDLAPVLTALTSNAGPAAFSAAVVQSSPGPSTSEHRSTAPARIRSPATASSISPPCRSPRRSRPPRATGPTPAPPTASAGTGRARSPGSRIPTPAFPDSRTCPPCRRTSSASIHRIPRPTTAQPASARLPPPPRAAQAGPVAAADTAAAAAAERAAAAAAGRAAAAGLEATAVEAGTAAGRTTAQAAEPIRGAPAQTATADAREPPRSGDAVPARPHLRPRSMASVLPLLVHRCASQIGRKKFTYRGSPAMS